MFNMFNMFEKNKTRIALERSRSAVKAVITTCNLIDDPDALKKFTPSISTVVEKEITPTIKHVGLDSRTGKFSIDIFMDDYTYQVLEKTFYEVWCPNLQQELKKNKILPFDADISFRLNTDSDLREDQLGIMCGANVSHLDESEARYKLYLRNELGRIQTPMVTVYSDPDKQLAILDSFVLKKFDEKTAANVLQNENIFIHMQPDNNGVRAVKCLPRLGIESHWMDENRLRIKSETKGTEFDLVLEIESLTNTSKLSEQIPSIEDEIEDLKVQQILAVDKLEGIELPEEPAVNVEDIQFEAEPEDEPHLILEPESTIGRSMRLSLSGVISKGNYLNGLGIECLFVDDLQIKYTVDRPELLELGIEELAEPVLSVEVPLENEFIFGRQTLKELDQYLALNSKSETHKAARYAFSREHLLMKPTTDQIELVQVASSKRSPSVLLTETGAVKLDGTAKFAHQNDYLVVGCFLFRFIG